MHAFFCIVSCWQCVKNRKGLVKERSFHCIRVNGVLPPMNCHGLGQAMCQNACRLALVEACMDVFVSFWDGTMGKNSDGLVKELSFVCIRGGGASPPMCRQTLGQAMRQKPHHLASVGGCMDVFILSLVCGMWENAMHG